MQLFALDCHQQLVVATKARKRQDYFCLECKGAVRLRSGVHRQAHYFHLQPSLTCRLSAKSMAHLQVQCYLQRLFSHDDCHIEKRFPTIGRIADVAWISRKLIFEVQCSPISAEEVRARISDYASIGFQVIWILHDKLYNRYRLSAAEMALEAHPYYFTNINGEGHGIIYDQFDVTVRGIRRRKLPPLSIEMTLPQAIPANESQSQIKVPKLWQDRMGSWPLHFGGDLIAQGLEGTEYIALACEVEQEMLPQKSSWRGADLLYKCFVRPYNLLFQLLLERACK